MRSPLLARQADPTPRRAAVDALVAAEGFADLLQAIERGAWLESRTLPTADELALIQTAFWAGLVDTLVRCSAQAPPAQAARIARQVRTALHPWLLRSTVWNQSIVKPNGHLGDHQTLEALYELEGARSANPAQPVVVNLLDVLARSVDGVQAVWERRRWFTALIERALAGGVRPLRVLDLGCGSGRVLRDVLERHAPGSVRATLIDHDPAALAYIDRWLTTTIAGDCRLVCASPLAAAQARHDGGLGRLRSFDLILCTSLLDYLDASTARSLLHALTELAAPGATLATSALVPRERQRVVSEWIVDWPLVYRHPNELAELLRPARPRLEAARRGGVVFATATVP